MTHNDTKTKKQGVVVANKTTLATITLSLLGCFEEGQKEPWQLTDWWEHFFLQPFWNKVLKLLRS
jgi:hypothetical protein